MPPSLERDRNEIAHANAAQTLDDVLLAQAFQAAVAKARELGGLCKPEETPPRGESPGSLSKGNADCGSQ